MFRFLIFLTFIILIQKLLKSLQEQQKEQAEPNEEEIRDYFQTLGFPPPREIPPAPKPEKPKKPLIEKKKIKSLEAEFAQVKPVKIKPAPKQTEDREEELSITLRDKLEEGIILSEILGPPKAYQIRRGGGTGIHAGLKNP
jgi:hypothetical protein